MKIVYTDRHRLHSTAPRVAGCPFIYNETPERAEAIRLAVEKDALGEIVGPEDRGLPPILAIHDPQFVDYLRTAYALTRAQYNGGTHPVLADTYASRIGRHRPKGTAGLVGYYAFDIACPILEGTWTAAYWSAQTALKAADLVRQGDGGGVAYALCRPPGHHASTSLHGGFCYLNNAAIAAKSLLADDPEGRVAILDIDYHHGNGTQEIFYKEPAVMVCSIHADPDLDYPFYWGGQDERGEGPGQDRNRNFPLPLGTDDAGYLATLNDALAAIAAFKPKAVVISVGFDLMQGDPVPMGGGFRVTPEGLAMIGHLIESLKLPTVLVQEGGYNVERLGTFAATFLKQFAGRKG